MKKKKLLIWLMIITSSIIIGCTSKISNEDKVIDSVVIDEEAKDTANKNNKINITKIATTENLVGSKNVSILRSDGKLVHINFNEETEINDISTVQFKKQYISSLSIGTITDEIQNNRNVVTWENKDINGQLITEYMGVSEQIKVLKNDKVYELDENYNLKEATEYKKLIEDTNADINRFQLSYDENLEIYFTDNNDKIVVIDRLNDKYYEVDNKILDSFKNRQLNILMAEDNKLYVSLTDTANKEVSILGYIENNKLTTFFDENSEIKVRVTGDVVYSDNNMLFSGYVEDSYGIWSYNIETKKLEKQIQLKYDYSYFRISKDKNFIIISNMDTGYIENYNVSLARIDNNFKISNIQELTNSILPNRSSSNGISVISWSNNGNKFYVSYVKSKIVDGALKMDDIYYEIYEVK